MQQLYQQSVIKMSFSFTSELVRKFVSSFEDGNLKPKKKQIPYRIKVNGRYIRLKSGKTIWKCLGHAKTALHNHFETTIYYPMRYTERQKLWGDQLMKVYPHDLDRYHAFLDYLVTEKIVEFVAVPAE